MKSATAIHNEKIALIHQRIPIVLVISFLVASLLSFGLWAQSQSISVLYWLGVIYTLLFFRLMIYSKMPASSKETVTRYSSSPYMVISFISGIAWGSVVVFILPQSLVDMVPATLMLCAMMAGLVPGVSYNRSIYIAFALPVTAFLMYGFFSIGNNLANYIGVLTALYFLACVYFCHCFYYVVSESLNLRYENVDLLENLKIEKEASEKANKDKSHFFAAASHDMSQPLHALSIFLEILRLAESENERENLHDKIDLSLNSLGELFTALLDISKLDAGGIDIQISNFSLDEILNDLISEFDESYKNKNLKIIKRTCKGVLQSDRLMLTRILRNILENAINYTEEGGVLISCRERSDHILIQVWDTGFGIPAHDLDDIFLEFKQLHNFHRDRANGLGLGLAIVKRLCQLMNISISVRSTLNRGSVFSLKLPKTEVKEIGNERKVQEQDCGFALSLNILVIDDESTILIAMQLLFEKWGCQILTAESLEDAYEKLEAESFLPDVVLADMHLRDNQTGIEAIDAISRKYGASISGLLITGDTSPDGIKLIKESSYEALHKPVKPEEIKKVLQGFQVSLRNE